MVQFKLILKKNIQRSTGNRNGTEEKETLLDVRSF